MSTSESIEPTLPQVFKTQNYKATLHGVPSMGYEHYVFSLEGPGIVPGSRILLGTSDKCGKQTIELLQRAYESGKAAK